MKIKRLGESIFLSDEIMGMVEVDITAKYGLSKEDFAVLTKPDKVHIDWFSCFLSAFIGLVIDTVIRTVEKWNQVPILKDTVFICEVMGILVLIILLQYFYNHHRRNMLVSPGKKKLLESIDSFYREKNELIKCSLNNNIKIK